MDSIGGRAGGSSQRPTTARTFAALNDSALLATSAQVRSIRPSFADRRSPHPKDKRDGDQQHGKEAKYAGRPPVPQTVIHRVDEEREDGGQGAAQKGVGGDGAGAVGLKGVYQVIQRALEDCEEAEADERGADKGSYPRDALVRRPA